MKLKFLSSKILHIKKNKGIQIFTKEEVNKAIDRLEYRESNGTCYRMNIYHALSKGRKQVPNYRALTYANLSNEGGLNTVVMHVMEALLGIAMKTHSFPFSVFSSKYHPLLLF